MRELVPTVCPLECPKCGARVTIELPPDAEPGRGIQTCPNRHDFLFVFDGLRIGGLRAIGSTE